MYIQKGEEVSMNGENYYLAAVRLTDEHPGTQFREMLGYDSLKSGVERLYFTGEYRELELMGWNTFCLKMEAEGQKKWLDKIKALDSEVVLDYLEQQLMQASRDGKGVNRGLLEATVKALQGVTALNKIVSDNEAAGGGNVPLVEVRFIGEEGDPISGYGKLPAGREEEDVVVDGEGK